MLQELRVENLLLIERAELRLEPGLNVLTGETGAGKTMLAQALELLLGGRARAEIVRPGASEAYVEGAFSIPAREGLLSDASETVRDALERVPEGAQELVLARRVWPDGRSRAYLCGRSATVAELRELGGRLLTFYGQHEHRKLMLATAQLELLDSYCGPEQAALRDRLASTHTSVRELERRATRLREIAGARERELDLLAFELDEIDAAAPSEEEEAALVAERDRLRSLEQLREAAVAGAQAIAPDTGEGVLELLAGPVRGLEAVVALDGALQALHERLLALVYEAQDIGGELRRYALEEDAAPERLEELEQRLERFARLKRKHGGTIGDVLAHAERCRQRLEELERADDSLKRAHAELEVARSELERLAAELSERRRAAAPELSAAVERRLEELALAEAEFSVELKARPEGIGARGADLVEFKIATNPGLTAGPVREIASGGELSRVMLALMGAVLMRSKHEAHTADAREILVFDEVDSGIGGHTARAVGEHLRALARHRQILCITHLPQVASLAERHFRIDKLKSAAAMVARVSQLDGDDVVGELVRMLGAEEQDTAANEHARQLLRAA